MKNIFFATILVLIILLSGCSNSKPETTRIIPEINFLVYLDGDNDLEEYGIWDVNEMELIGSSAKINILVLFDRHPDFTTSNGNWSSTRLYKITRDRHPHTINSQLLKDYGELDMDDPTTLKNFVVYCTQNFPAQRTILTLWNHGAGVYPRNKKISKGICFDDTSPNTLNALTTAEVRTALAEAREITGQKIAVLNMDACSMQLAEIAWEWREEADFLVGSTAGVPDPGNNYTLVLHRLTRSNNFSSAVIAAGLVTDFNICYSQPVNNFYYQTTYSAVALPEMESFLTVFNELATQLHNYSAKNFIKECIAQTIIPDQSLPEIKDLASFTTALINHPNIPTSIKHSATNLKIILKKIVPYHKYTGTFTSELGGLGILLPSNQSEWQKYEAYSTLKFATTTAWDELLSQLYD